MNNAKSRPNEGFFHKRRCSTCYKEHRPGPGIAMLNKIFTILVAVPVGILLVVFAVANRHAVTVSLDPFGADSPALSATMPLFLLVLLLLGTGVVAGGFATWLSQAKWRRAARYLDTEARHLRAEREALKIELARQHPALPAAAEHR